MLLHSKYNLNVLKSNSSILSSASVLVFFPLIVGAHLNYAINTAQFIKKLLEFFIKNLTSPLGYRPAFCFSDEFNSKYNA